MSRIPLVIVATAILLAVLMLAVASPALALDEPTVTPTPTATADPSAPTTTPVPNEVQLTKTVLLYEALVIGRVLLYAGIVAWRYYRTAAELAKLGILSQPDYSDALTQKLEQLARMRETEVPDNQPVVKGPRTVTVGKRWEFTAHREGLGHHRPEHYPGGGGATVGLLDVKEAAAWTFLTALLGFIFGVKMTSKPDDPTGG